MYVYPRIPFAMGASLLSLPRPLYDARVSLLIRSRIFISYTHQRRTRKGAPHAVWSKRASSARLSPTKDRSSGIQSHRLGIELEMGLIWRLYGLHMQSSKSHCTWVFGSSGAWRLRFLQFLSNLRFSFKFVRRHCVAVIRRFVSSIVPVTKIDIHIYVSVL